MSNTRTFSPGMRAKLASLGFTPDQVGRPMAAIGTATDVADMTIPDTPAGLEEFAADNKRILAVLQSGQFPDFIQKYASVVLNKHQDIATMVQEQTQQVLASWLKEQDEDGARPRIDLRGPADVTRMDARSTLHNPQAMGAAIDSEFNGSGDYFRSIWHLANRSASDQQRLGRVRNAFSSTVPSEGGFLIPETLRSELLSVGLETSIVRPRARTIPMESLTVPFPMVDATTNNGSVYGGIIAYWTEEAAALTQSSAKFGRVVLTAKKLTAYTEVPNELISDSAISFQTFIDTIFPEALGWYEDIAFLSGTGVGEPLGALYQPGTTGGNGSIITVTKESGQAAGTILWANIVKMYARMLPSSLNRAVWLVSPDTFPELATMALEVGTGGSAVWLTNGASSAPMTILGRPVIVTEKVSALGTKGDIAFVDFGFYLIGDRQVMSAMSSPHYKFGNDMTAYRIIERVDGRPWLQSAITPKNSSATLSPFVVLETRS